MNKLNAERLSEPARIVLQLAFQEAQRCNCPFVRTDHMLLALVKERKSDTAQLLERLGVNIGVVRRMSEAVFLCPPQSTVIDKPPFSQKLERLVSIADDLSKRDGGGRISISHLFTALLQMGGDAPAFVILFSALQQKQEAVVVPDGPVIVESNP